MEMPEWLAGDGSVDGAPPISGIVPQAPLLDGWSLARSAADMVEQARVFLDGVGEGLGAPLLEVADRQFADAEELAAGGRTGSKFLLTEGCARLSRRQVRP
ncbi:hypothetical protein [Arthrobacter livingstonensis]|nr:hypothetical protein [Arthrobacter livingstonensis]